MAIITEIGNLQVRLPTLSVHLPKRAQSKGMKVVFLLVNTIYI